MRPSLHRLLLAGIMAFVLHGMFFLWPFPAARTTLPEPAPMQKIRVSLHTRKPVIQKVVVTLKPQKKVVVSEQKKAHSKPRPVLKLVVPVPLEVPAIKKKVASTPVAEERLQEDQPIMDEKIISQELVTTKQQSQTERTSRVIQQATPLYQVNPPPEYPRLARRRGMEGVVLLTALIDISGHVQGLEIITSSGHNILDQAALKAVQHWLFHPGIIDNKLHEMWVNVPVRFRLQ